MDKMSYYEFVCDQIGWMVDLNDLCEEDDLMFSEMYEAYLNENE